MAQLPGADDESEVGDVSASNGNGNAPGLSLGVPPELVEAIASQVAEMVAAKTPEHPDPYLRIEEAAAYLACPISRIRDLKDQGKLRHYRDGTRLLFRRADLDAALTIREPEPR